MLRHLFSPRNPAHVALPLLMPGMPSPLFFPPFRAWAGPPLFPPHPLAGRTVVSVQNYPSTNKQHFSLTGNSPLGALFDNTPRVFNHPLVKHSFDGDSVSTGDIIKQTSPPLPTAITPVRVDCHNTSDLGLKADFSPLLPVFADTIVASVDVGGGRG